MMNENERAAFETSVRLTDARLLAYARAETRRAARIESELAELAKSYPSAVFSDGAETVEDTVEAAKEALRALFGIVYAGRRVGYGVAESEWTASREESERVVKDGLAALASDITASFKEADDELYG